jgi:hypothetical protein
LSIAIPSSSSWSELSLEVSPPLPGPLLSVPPLSVPPLPGPLLPEPPSSPERSSPEPGPLFEPSSRESSS